jgi:hypothetical protein
MCVYLASCNSNFVRRKFWQDRVHLLNMVKVYREKECFSFLRITALLFEESAIAEHAELDSLAVSYHQVGLREISIDILWHRCKYTNR